MFARLIIEKQSEQEEEQKQRDEQVHEAPVASDEIENPASPTSQDLNRAADSVVPVEVGPRENQSSESGQDRAYGLYDESANTQKSKVLHTHDEDGSPRLEGKKSVSGLSTEG